MQKLENGERIDDPQDPKKEEMGEISLAGLFSQNDVRQNNHFKCFFNCSAPIILPYIILPIILFPPTRRGLGPRPTKNQPRLSRWRCQALLLQVFELTSGGIGFGHAQNHDFADGAPLERRIGLRNHVGCRAGGYQQGRKQRGRKNCI